jgi:hypothetical protein
MLDLALAGARMGDGSRCTVGGIDAARVCPTPASGLASVMSFFSIAMRPRELTSDTAFFEVEVFDVWPAANRSKQNIGLELMESRL